MQFKIASQTKTFTAHLVLQLVGEGKLGLDDHIATWVGGVPNGDEITIRQLLNHTSGLADGFTSPTIQSKVVTGDVGPTQAPTVVDDATDLPASCLWAHGGMVSTLDDMRVWAVSLATGSLLTPEIWKEATTDMIPFVFGGNYNGHGQWRYGLGFVETGGFYGAEGSFAGYESATMHSPTLNATIEVASTKMPNALLPPPIMQALAIAVYGTDVDFGLSLDQAMQPNLGASHEPAGPTTTRVFVVAVSVFRLN